VPPNITKLAIYDRGRSVYEQTPILLTTKKTDTGYILPKIPVILTGKRKLSFAIQAYDRSTYSNNPNGIFSAQLLFDAEPKAAFLIDSINYKETSYMNAHIDYRFRYNGGAFLQHLSRLPGDLGVVYEEFDGDGIITLNDTLRHAVSIVVKDVFENTSMLNFAIQFSDSLAGLLPPAPPQREVFIPGNVNVLEKPDFELYIPEDGLYDTVSQIYYRNNALSSNAISAGHQVNDASIPVHDDITVRIKPVRSIPQEWKDKVVIQRSSRNRTVKKAELQGDWLTAKFSDFGTFQAFVDLTAPSINAPGKLVRDTVDLSPATRIIFYPADNFGVKSFRAELNGKWLRFTNDKGRAFIYVFDERVPFGTYELKVTVEDIVGNTTVKTWNIKKYPYTPPKKKLSKKKKSKSKKSGPTKKKVTKKK
jgi:hypothetical protein